MARADVLTALFPLLPEALWYERNDLNETIFDVSKKEIKVILAGLMPYFRTIILHHEDCIRHHNPEGHQEQPGRIAAVLSKIDGLPCTETSTDFTRASLDTLCLAHSKDYVNFVTR